ncbi:hypothetical protein D3C84_867420 [compost metagenome]
MVHAVFQAQGKTAVVLHRQVITRCGKIQGAGLDRRLVAGLHNRHRHAPGEHFGQMAAAFIRQVQHDNDRQHEAFTQRTEEIDQRLDATGRGADHNGFHRRQIRCTVHDLR